MRYKLIKKIRVKYEIYDIQVVNCTKGGQIECGPNSPLLLSRDSTKAGEENKRVYFYLHIYSCENDYVRWSPYGPWSLGVQKSVYLHLYCRMPTRFYGPRCIHTWSRIRNDIPPFPFKKNDSPKARRHEIECTWVIDTFCVQFCSQEALSFYFFRYMYVYIIYIYNVIIYII